MPLVRTVSVLLGIKGQEDVKAKLEQVKLRADELAKMDPTLTVDINTAAAEAKLAILRESLLRTSSAANKGFRLNVGSGAPGFLGSIQKALNSILSLGIPAIPILAAIGVAVLAIVTYLGSLVTELAAAGIGLAAFGALAIPTFMGIVSGIQGVSAAVAKVNTDRLTKGITSAQLAADKLAQDKAWAAIPVALQPAVKAGLGLKDTFDKMVAAMRPTAVKVFADALKTIKDLLPQLQPIAMSVGKAIDGLLKGFDGFVKSKGFKDFMSQMDALSGPAVTAIGKGLGQIAISLGNLITTASSPSGLLMLKGTFFVLAKAIDMVALSIRLSGNALQAFALIALSVGRGALNVARTITDAFLTMVGTIARIAAKIPGPWQSAMKRLSASVDGAKRTADNFFAAATNKLNAFTTAINSAKPVYKLQGDLTDLQNKVAASKALLKTVPKSQQVKILADISQAQARIAAIKFALSLIQNRTVYVNVITIPGTGPHRASGGPASGGTWVGERGPEFVDLPAGSYVHSNADSRRMMAGAGGGGGDTYNITVNVPVGTNPRETARHIADILNQGATAGVKLRKSLISANG